jgi:phage repressor protein C with HTH and peptisase S24 domain
MISDTFPFLINDIRSRIVTGMDMREILTALMRSKGDDAYTLQDKSGVPQPTTQRFLSGKHKSANAETVKRWASAYGVSESQLRGDLPIEELGSGTLQIAQALPEYKSHVTTITKFDDVGGAMGKGILLQDQPGQITNFTVTDEWVNKNVPMHTGKQNLKVVTGFGDSMKGMFNPGDPLLVDIGVTACNHDGVYFFRVGDEGFIKRLQRIPGQGIKVLSKNTDYEPWLITPEMDFQVLAKVLKAWQGEKL